MKFIFPRDAFNAANYYKCIGRIFLSQLDHPDNNWWRVVSMSPEGDAFDKMPEVQIDENSGDMLCPDIWLEDKKTGEKYALVIPCNSREPWPMCAEGDCHIFYMRDLVDLTRNVEAADDLFPVSESENAS